MIVATRRMGLGGAQFGMPYGVTGSGIAPDPASVQQILGRARAAGVGFLDTAPAYGDSEDAIGRTGLAPYFRIVSKVPKCLDRADRHSIDETVRQSIARSLARLQIRRLDAVLVHDAIDLLGANGPSLWTALERARDEGLCDRIGVSVYRADEIAAIIAKFPIDIVQMPYNILDQRLVGAGLFDRLAGDGVAIHVRSLFMQGLLLADPSTLHSRFLPVADAVKELRAWAADRGLSPLQAILSDVARHPGVECCLIGVHRRAELDAILYAAEGPNAEAPTDTFEPSMPLPEEILDPSRWHDLN